MKKPKREKENGISGIEGCAPNPTYTPFPLWSGLCLVDVLKELAKS